MWPDAGSTVDLCRWIDSCARMDAFGMFLRWEKKWQHSRHGYTRIRHTNDDFFRRSKIVINQYRRGRTLLCRGKVGLFLGKREIAGLGVIGRREAGQLDRTVAEDFSAEVLRDLVRRKGNKGMGKCHKLLRRRKIPFPLESEIVGPFSTYRSHRIAKIQILPAELGNYGYESVWTSYLPKCGFYFNLRRQTLGRVVSFATYPYERLVHLYRSRPVRLPA
jgi:hypothetical protein